MGNLCVSRWWPVCPVDHLFQLSPLPALANPDRHQPCPEAKCNIVVPKASSILQAHTHIHTPESKAETFNGTSWKRKPELIWPWTHKPGSRVSVWVDEYEQLLNCDLLFYITWFLVTLLWNREQQGHMPAFDFMLRPNWILTKICHYHLFIYFPLWSLPFVSLANLQCWLNTLVTSEFNLT